MRKLILPQEQFFHANGVRLHALDWGGTGQTIWTNRIRPWLRQRTAIFGQAAPTARIIELDSPYHHIFLADEDATANAIDEFLTSLR